MNKQKRISDLLGYTALLCGSIYFLYEYGWYILFEFGYLINGCSSLGTVIEILDANEYLVQYENCKGESETTSLKTELSYHIGGQIVVRISPFFEKVGFNPVQWIGILFSSLFLLFILSAFFGSIYKIKKIIFNEDKKEQN